MNLKNFINRKNLAKYQKLTQEVHRIEQSYAALPPEQLGQKLWEVKESTKLEPRKKILHAMALARKACSHVLGMSYYDVQIMGALALVDGCIAEMKTGEGKTLTCSAAVAANYVLGYGTHVATANEYLAKRDQEQLQELYSFLGISSSSNTSQMNKQQKREAYQCDVVYSTAQELGFDFLRDNLVYNIEEKIQPLDFHATKAIIDEADFILIDEARTPLIISGESPLKDVATYQMVATIARKMRKMSKEPELSLGFEMQVVEGDFWLDEKYKNVHLSDEGYASLEKLATEHGLLSTANHHGLYHNENSWIIHETINALKAHYLYIRDKDYIVHDGEIVIIDQNTGRLSQGRTWSNGLHQAIETKEGLTINPETMTLGSISVQNYFRTYSQISGMSGTVMQSSEEFEQIYNCKTIHIPTNRKMVRLDHQDKVYLNMKAKYHFIVEEIALRHKKGQPILIGTTSVAESEVISQLLSGKNIAHHVLNAKNNAKEAQIIAQAGQPYSVTVSTSMAGRGTDIILGGNKSALMQIMFEQLQHLQERRATFTLIRQQILASYQENRPDDDGQESSVPGELSAEVQEMNDEQIQIAPIAYGEVHAHIEGLYVGENMAALLSRGENFIAKYIEKLEQSINEQIVHLEQSWQQQRDHVMGVGGLCVIGSSRNESRRIDDQLRGRAGRQGDPGESIFYMSIEDPWVSVFGKNPLFSRLAKTLPENEAISSPIVTRAFAKAQANIEALHFDSRKNTFQYDSIADEGRKKFLQLRNNLLASTNPVRDTLQAALCDELMPVAHEDFTYYLEEKLKIKIDSAQELLKTVLCFPVEEVQMHAKKFMQDNPYVDMRDVNNAHVQMLENSIGQLIGQQDPTVWTQLNDLSLRALDKAWVNHLLFIDDAQKNVAFSSIAQKNPLHEYKKLCFESFSFMLEDFKQKIIADFLMLLAQEKNILQEYEEMEADLQDSREEVPQL